VEVYVDSSVLVTLYWWLEPFSVKATQWLEKTDRSIIFTPLHRHEVRTALRQKLYRKEFAIDELKQTLGAIDSDLKDGTLVHSPIPWTDAFREADNLYEQCQEILPARSLDLLHVGIALSLGAKEFATFDFDQGKLAATAGLKFSFNQS
jgi:predicted nucleic acid-binding protein